MKKIFFLTVLIYTGLMSQGRNLSGDLAWDILSMKNDSLPMNNSAASVKANHQNPFLNGLFSLAIPGAGQYRTDRYTKAAIFVAVEAALVTYVVINQNIGDKKTREFEKYANEHWSARRYADYINIYGANDYGPTGVNIDLNRVDNKDYSQINAWESGLHKFGFSHQLPKFGEQQYYELIGKYNQFKYGWDTYGHDANGVPISDGGTPAGYDDLLAAKDQFLGYRDRRANANSYYYAAGFAGGAIVINHVISALDAYLSTKNYNNEITSSMGLKMQEIGGTSSLVSELRIEVKF